MLKKAYDNVQNREIKSESGFSLTWLASPLNLFSFWYGNIKEAETIIGNISFVKTKTRPTMSFLDLLASRKAKLGGKFQAPEKQRHEVAGELDKEEVIEEVRGEVSEEVRDEASIYSLASLANIF